MEKSDVKRWCNSYVPEELVMEILLRLPVKSLLRFKSVSKSWWSLITNFDFIKNHYIVFNKNNSNTHILVYDYPVSSYLSGLASLDAFSYESLSCHHYLDHIRIPGLITNQKLDPVHGIIMLSEDNQIALLNPATRELSTLLVPEEQFLKSDDHSLGFGFDPLTNDIKVVAVWDVTEINETLLTRKKIAVYSLASNSWKHLDTFRSTYSCIAHHKSYYLNGVCYWLLINVAGGYSLLSFDLNSEVVRQIKGPDDTVSKNKDATLFLYNNESLGMFLCKHKENYLRLVDSFDILLMEKDCWRKHVRLDVSLLQVNVLRLLGVWKDNILLETVDNLDIKRLDPKLALYDLVSHKFKKLETSHRSYFNPKVFSYKESLVSVVKKGEIYSKESWPDLINFCAPKTYN